MKSIIIRRAFLAAGLVLGVLPAFAQAHRAGQMSVPIGVTS